MSDKTSLVIFLDPVQGTPEKFFAVGDVEFLFHAETVRLDGLGADIESRGNLLRVYAIADELKDFQFTIGEAFFGPTAFSKRATRLNADEQFFGHGFAQVNLAFQNSPDGVHDFFGRLVFGDVT